LCLCITCNLIIFQVLKLFCCKNRHKVSEANAERDLALLSKAKMIENQCVVVKEAERAARITERQRLSIDGHRFKSKNTELSSKISELMKQVHSAEKKEREAIRQAKQSTQRSKDIMTVTDCFKA